MAHERGADKDGVGATGLEELDVGAIMNAALGDEDSFSFARLCLLYTSDAADE